MTRYSNRWLLIKKVRRVQCNNKVRLVNLVRNLLIRVAVLNLFRRIKTRTDFRELSVLRIVRI